MHTAVQQRAEVPGCMAEHRQAAVRFQLCSQLLLAINNSGMCCARQNNVWGRKGWAINQSHCENSKLTTLRELFSQAATGTNLFELVGFQIKPHFFN